MSRRRKRRGRPGLLGWASLILFGLLTTLALLWVLRPLKEPPPRLKIPAPRPIPPQRPHSKPRKRALRPMAAIIIDDMGQRPTLERKFFTLGLPLNFSFLPFAPYTKVLAQEAHARGFEVLVHLPLEARLRERAPGFISLKMDEEEVKRRVRATVKAVPYAVGINHHEGSLFTEDRRHTRWLLEEVAALGLLYIDSRTTPATKIPEVAQSLGLPWAERRIFLDHQPKEEAVRRAISTFIKRTYQKGPTIAIGHPHPATLRALMAERKRLQEKLKLVPISVFVKNFGRGQK